MRIYIYTLYTSVYISVWRILQILLHHRAQLRHESLQRSDLWDLLPRYNGHEAANMSPIYDYFFTNTVH
jgi:hypothetical protein